MRGSTPAWPRPLLVVALASLLVGCSLSLRGGGLPPGAVATATPLAAGGAPSVAIATPATGTVSAVGQTIDVDVRASDQWPVGVARLELFAGDLLVDRAVSAGGSNRLNFGAILEWTPFAPGAYQLSAIAYRADGTPSAPAVITVVITGAAMSPFPSASVVLATPSALPSDSGLPSFTLLPTPPPTREPTPKPTAKPTPTPTPAPVAVHVDVWVDEADLPDWTVGQIEALVIHVQNIGGETVPYVRVLASLAGSSSKTRTGTLVPGQETTVVIHLSPTTAGDEKLTVTGKLPPGYVDSDPIENTLVWERIVTVNAAPAETSSPSPAPSP